MKKVKTIELVLGLGLFIVGFGIIGNILGWKISLAVYLIIWANNIQLRNK